MRERFIAIALITLLDASASGCTRLAGEFHCTDDTNCVSATHQQGTCQTTTGWCSFPDTDCMSHERYADQSGSASGQCIPPPVSTAPPDGPMPPPACTSHASSVVAGEHTSCARDGDRAWCWGLGAAPAAITLPAGVIDLALGGAGLCAVLTKGEVYCGDSLGAQLKQIAQLNALSVSVGDRHFCAVTTDHRAVCWGKNDAGQLGLGTTIEEPAPTEVIGGIGSVSQIAAGLDTTCAVTAPAGQIWCWGNKTGPLGRTVVVDDGSTPKQVSSINLPAASAVSVGDDVACALSGGGAWCWGANDRGQLGVTLSTTDSPKAPHALTTLTGVAQLVSGGSHSCARSGTDVACWGDNASGQSSGMPPTAILSPQQLTDRAGQPIDLTDIATGSTHSCGITTAGDVECWGNNIDGQAAIGSATSVPPGLIPLPCP